jgi:hypothetical protein
MNKLTTNPLDFSYLKTHKLNNISIQRSNLLENLSFRVNKKY